VLIRHGKGDRQRWVGIGERTVDALEDYIGLRRAAPRLPVLELIGRRARAPVEATAAGLAPEPSIASAPAGLAAGRTVIGNGGSSPTAPCLNARRLPGGASPQF